MSHITLLALNGLSCMRCVNSVRNALESRDDVEHIQINSHYAKIISSAEDNSLIDTVISTGYQASLATQPDITLHLTGLHCIHCINSLRQALEALPDVIMANVTLTRADIFGYVSTDTLLDVVKKAGYQATIATSSENAASPLIDDDQQQKKNISNTITTEKEQNYLLLLEGMSCASCVSKVQKALESVPGVRAAQVNLAERSALVYANNIEPQQLISAVKQAGYSATLIGNNQQRAATQQQNKRHLRRLYWQAALALALGIPLMLWGMFGGEMRVMAENQRQWLILGLVTLIIMVIAGSHFYRNAWHALKNKTATMDTLIALGTASAWLYSIAVTLWPQAFPPAGRYLYYEASVMIIGLINIGQALELRARQHASQALERLLSLTPPTARMVSTQGEQIIALAEVKVGMTLRLTAGDRAGVDGQVSSGEAWINEAMLTGESKPQQKNAGDKIHAGTIVEDGSLLYQTTAIGEQTMLARIIQLVRQAQSSKPEIGKLVDKISAIFVPIVVTIALLSAGLWYLFGPTPQLTYALVIMTTVLIIACPCALGLATPMSIIAGVGRAAELGILIRDADALQRACQIDTLVFDKTGTLTEGQPVVTDIITFTQIEKQQALIWAAALEQGANHPLARAILAKAGNQNLPESEQLRVLRGLGVSGNVKNTRLLLGNLQLLQTEHIEITSEQKATIEQLAAKGHTPVLLAANGNLVALFTIYDPLRADSRQALQRLHHAGYKLVMLTGDNPTTANIIAQQAGIEQVIANVLPDGKAQVIANLQKNSQKVAMIGDGINDAPALAQADIGIALSNGSDIAIESASMTLMHPSINGVFDALQLSHATLNNMKQNLLGAFIYNILAIPVAAGVLYPLTGQLLSPIIASAAMALSSITVVSNANRLLKFTPKSQ